MSNKSDEKNTLSDLRVFISYARDANEDRKYAELLAEELIERDLTTCFNENEIKAGEDWSKQIHEAIENSHLCIVLLSHASTSRKPWISKEWTAIQECVWRRPDLLVCPVYLEDIEIPVFLRNCHSLKLDSKYGNIDATADQIQILCGRFLENKLPIKVNLMETEVNKRFNEILHSLESLKQENEQNPSSDDK